MNIVRILATWLVVMAFSSAVRGQTVYITPSGSKYHLADCRTVRNVSERLTVRAAQQRGLQPCRICNSPGVEVPAYGSGNKKTQGEGHTVQCRGITKAGARCKHKTSIGNGYCFQHQPK